MCWHWLGLGLLAGLAGSWFGVVFAWRAAALLHLGYVLLYAVAGVCIGALWPLRRSAAGHFGLRCIASAAISVTVASVTLGPLWQWPASAWPRVAIMVPAFAWVFGSARKRPRDAAAGGR